MTYPTLPDFGLVIIAVLNIKIGIVDLVKKQIMMLKIRNQGEIFTTSDYNKFTSDILDAKIKQKQISQ